VRKIPQKLWAKLIKGPEVRFISHLDLLRAVERALRRAGVPMVFSKGYNPRPKISFASALPVGMTSGGEYAEFILKHSWPPKEFQARLNEQLPIGLEIVAIKEVAYNFPALTAVVNLACYRINFFLPPGVKAVAFFATWEDFYKQEKIQVRRQTKKGIRVFDLLPHVYGRKARLGENDNVTLNIDLSFGPRGSLRPAELLQAFWDFAGWEGRMPAIQREGLFILRDDGIFSPLEVDF